MDVIVMSCFSHIGRGQGWGLLHRNHSFSLLSSTKNFRCWRQNNNNNFYSKLRLMEICLAHPFFWIPRSIMNARGLTTKDGQSTAISDLSQGAGRFSISSWYSSRPGYDCIHGCRIFSGISLICSIGVSLGKMDGASQFHDPLLCLDL